MIYISSSCIKSKNIKDTITLLVKNGFKNIELSGGTEYYEGLIDDLLDLKNKYNLNYLCHNYFPPPKEHFVLNLASLDKTIYAKSLEHIEEAIKLSIKIGSPKYSFHAGFFVSPDVNQLGKLFSPTKLYDKKEALTQFCSGYRYLKKIADGIDLYIENNVLSYSNHKIYKYNPLMLLTYADFVELKQEIDFNLLLDVAHLKVNCNTLSLNFEEQLHNLFLVSDYIHLSDNDSMHDRNIEVKKDSELYNILKHLDSRGKTITLEIYEEIDKIKNTFNNIGHII
jgi:sugar phosphate isomerase/epimerase